MTKIEWTKWPYREGRTWNPVTGCRKISAGCKHCYAETIATRFWKDRAFTDVICHDDRLDTPRTWRKPAAVFVNSMSDLFHEDVPHTFVATVWAVMKSERRHVFIVLTKRPDRALAFAKFAADAGMDLRAPNIIVGVSAEDQAAADLRIPALWDFPAVTRCVSVEPMLGPVAILYAMTCRCGCKDEPVRRVGPFGNGISYENCGFCYRPRAGLDWVIVGAESGHGARDMDLAWARTVRDECALTGAPFFMKQICSRGRKVPVEDWPDDLRVREFPTVTP